MVSDELTAQTARDALASVVDPEIPVLTIEDMGIVRKVEATEDSVEVDITPTYSGCPAMDQIASDVRAALTDAGFSRVVVNTVYSPAWTTDWMSDSGKQKLEEYGIAPPPDTAHADRHTVLCPQCRSDETATISEYGSTACKALMVCESCREPFDLFKAL